MQGDMKSEITGDALLRILEALANPHRLRIVAQLFGKRTYVSQLAREMEMSRPLLYMHLKKMESAGLVMSQLELSDDGKAMNFFELTPFMVELSPKVIASAVTSLSNEETKKKRKDD